MRIVVNDIAASIGGAMTILKDFYNCVRENDTENEWIFLLGDKYFEETENIRILTFPQIKNSKLKKMKFDFFEGKKIISELKPDVVFSLQNVITFGLKAPQVTYIHQPIPFQSTKKFSLFKRSERAVAIYQYFIGSVIKRSAKKADKVIVQTTWIRDAVCKKCRISEDKVTIIAPNIPDVSGYELTGSFDGSEFFYPTSTAIYKNIGCLERAADILTAEGYNFSVSLTLAGNSKHENVRYIGRIPYADVINRYSGGTLVFPSYIESFGYPLVEARTVGTVVLASDCPFSRELLAGYENAYFFDPFNPNELADLMKRVICGDIVKKDVEREAIEPRNSWLDVIRAVTETKKR